MKKIILLFTISLLAVSCSRAPQNQNNNSALVVPFDQYSNEPPVNSNKNSVAEFPSGCQDVTEAAPVITAMTPRVGNLGTKVNISGCNFLGFEGDKVAWIENQKGEKGYLAATRDNDSKKMTVKLDSPLCQQDVSYSGSRCPKELVVSPGKYMVYVSAWGKDSNKVEFEVK
jgi:hypothetical protein